MLRCSAFSFVSNMFIISCGSIFMMAPLKSLSDHSNIYANFSVGFSVLVDCLISFKLRSSWVLVWWIIFLLKTECFWYYVLRIWILLKSPILPGLLWHWSGRRRRGAPLTPSGGRSAGFLVGLTWHFLNKEEQGTLLLTTRWGLLPGSTQSVHQIHRGRGSHYHHRNEICGSPLRHFLPPLQQRGGWVGVPHYNLERVKV